MVESRVIQCGDEIDAFFSNQEKSGKVEMKVEEKNPITREDLLISLENQRAALRLQNQKLYEYQGTIMKQTIAIEEQEIELTDALYELDTQDKRIKGLVNQNLRLIGLLSFATGWLLLKLMGIL